LFTRPASVSPPSAARTCVAAFFTACSSVMSNRSGVKFAPSSFDTRSAPALFRTLPKTRKPVAIRVFALA
jgi:hypothetical protein